VNQLLVHTASTIKHADMEGIVNEYFYDSEDSNFDSNDEFVVNHVSVAEMVNNIDSEHEDNIDQSGNTCKKTCQIMWGKEKCLQYLWITICNQICLQICQSSSHFSLLTGEINCCEHCHGKTHQIK
jgi:hypothetical protein